jgi:hypothetical protein
MASFGKRAATIDDHVQSASVATAMQAVNAIPALCESEPGWRSALALGPVHAGIGFRGPDAGAESGTGGGLEERLTSDI